MRSVGSKTLPGAKKGYEVKRRMIPAIAAVGSGLLIAAKGAQSSDRKTLLVLDERTGAVVQEIGPVRAVVGIVPSPDGARAAVFGHDTIRIYRVDHQG